MIPSVWMPLALLILHLKTLLTEMNLANRAACHNTRDIVSTWQLPNHFVASLSRFAPALRVVPIPIASSLSKLETAPAVTSPPIAWHLDLSLSIPLAPPAVDQPMVGREVYTVKPVGFRWACCGIKLGARLCSARVVGLPSSSLAILTSQ